MKVAIRSIIDLSLLLVLCFPFMVTRVTHAWLDDPNTILFVDGTDGDANGDGSDWDHAFKYLHDAIVAASGHTPPVAIWVRAGVYRPDEDKDHEYPNGTGSRLATFAMAGDLRLYGGFIGVESANEFGFNHRNPRDNETILSGDLLEDDEDIYDNTDDNSYHIVSAIHVDDTAIIDGFTIQSGNAIGAPAPTGYSGTISEAGGGGMLIVGGPSTNPSKPNVLRCRFLVNQATDGAGVWAVNAQVASAFLSNCEFLANHAANDGGGLYGWGPGCEGAGTGGLEIVNSLFHLNHADAGHGGGIYCGKWSGATITNCTIVDNSAAEGADGVHHDNIDANCEPAPTAGAGATLTNCIIWDNGTVGLMGDHNFAFTTDCQDFATGPDGYGNIGVDPDFYDPGSGDFRLVCGSPCVDKGDNGSSIPFDDFDLDQDTNESERTPDLDRSERLVAMADMGAYELLNLCAADVNNDGVINTGDLLEVINHWGTYGSPWDFAPMPCGGNGSVGTAELLFIINHWAEDCVTFELQDMPPFSTVQDCMDAASEEYEPFTEEWNNYVEKCTDGLRAANLIE